MMRKLFLAALLAAALTAAAGCAIFPDSGERDTGTSLPGENGDLEGGGAGENGAGGADPETPGPVKSGNLLDYFGYSMEEIGHLLGEPDELGYFEGAEYYAYPEQKAAFFFWAEPGEEAVVRSIHLSRGAEVAGIRVGMTFTEIKAILGTPLYEGFSEHEDCYTLVCDYGEFRLFFSADAPDGQTAYVRIKYIVDS